MAELTAQEITLEGTQLSFTVASSEDTFKNDGKRKLFLKNTDSTSHDVTIVAQKKCNHGFLHDQTISVPASSEVVVSNIENGRFNDENGMVHLTYGGNEAMFEVAVTKDY